MSGQEDRRFPAKPFMPERWQTSMQSKVFHVSHPYRDAWCGQKWTATSSLGGFAPHMCRRCRLLGEGL